MVTVQMSSLLVFESTGAEGYASSNRAAEPHCLMIQSGASRSSSPVRLSSEIRFWEARNSESVNWYRSMNRPDGRVQ